MKHRVINRDKIVEAWIKEPYDGDGIIDPRGWRVMIGLDYNNGRRISIDMDSEQDCINFINSLEMLPIKSTK